MKYTQYDFLDELPLAVYPQENWIVSNRDIPYLHCHNALEIAYWVEGEGNFRIEGKEYTLRAGDICVICPKTMHHSFIGKGIISRCKYLYIDLVRFMEMFPIPIDGIEYLRYHSPEFVNIIRQEDSPELVPLILDIFFEIEKKPLHYQSSVLSRMGLLLIGILRQQESVLENRGEWHKENFMIADSLDYMDGHYAEDISTEMLAHSCHMSQTNYRRVFGKIMGTSPMMYLNRIRIEKACEKLFSTTDTIADIAGKVGYTSISAFNNNFKRFMNCSPQQWRKVARLNRK